MEQTQSLFRDAFGDSVVVYRGLSEASGNPSGADASNAPAKLADAAASGEEVSHEHRPAESWTADPGYAARYAKRADRYGEPDAEGALLQREVPVDQILIASHSSGLGLSESEIVVMHDEEVEYDPDQIIPASEIDNKTLVQEALQQAQEMSDDSIEREAAAGEVNQQTGDDTGDVLVKDNGDTEYHINAEEIDPQWLHEDPPGDQETADADDMSEAGEFNQQTGGDTGDVLVNNWEFVPLSELPVTATDMKAIAADYKEWTRYQGPRGGMGWRNTETNEVVYDDDPPGETVDAPGRDTTLDVGDIEPEVVGSQFDDEDLDPPPEDELPENTITEATPQEFTDSVGDVLEDDPSKGAFLAEHPPAELEDHTLLTADEGAAGVAISPSGDIQNLHAGDDAPSGTGEKLLREAVAEGGRTLDNYDTFLTRLYARNGFREVARMDFNAEFAPEEWDYDEYGYPDVVFMAHDPDSEYERTDEYITADEWGEAKEQSLDRADGVTESQAAMTQQQDDNSGYDAAAEIQKFIDEAVENRGEEAVARNIDGLLAGLRPVMQVPDKSELDIPSVEESDGEK